MTSPLPSRVEVSTEVLLQEVAGEAVLLDLASESYFGLNEVGVRLWKLLADNGDTKVAIATLVAEYDVEESVLRKDIENHLARLAEKGLIKAVGGDDAGKTP